jgi:two-component system sensor histidine kinase MprB
VTSAAHTPGVSGIPSGVSPPRFGGAAGYAQLISSTGHIVRPAGEQAAKGRPAPTSTTRPFLPTDGAADVASGRRDGFYRDATVDGTHLRMYTAPLRTGLAVQIALPLTDVDSILARLRLIFLGVLVRRHC